MTASEFKASLKDDAPPESLDPFLLSLWYDAKGSWDKAHEIAQNIITGGGSWIHAYLHRKEGDTSNASYWYMRAGKRMPTCSFEEEWENMLKEFTLN